MGVYSKDGISRTPGQDMPDNCFYDCRLLDTCLHVPRWGSEEILDRLKIERAKNCPLVEVQEPHGRLIDADFEEKHYASMTINPTPDVTPQDHMHSGYAAKAFQMAKTVIEAEGE